MMSIKLISRYGLVALCSMFTSCSVLMTPSECMTHKAYHLKEPVHHLWGEGNHYRVPLCFLEFDDQGEPWAAERGLTQLQASLAALDEEKRRGEVLMLMYVHGWQHNANKAQSRDVERFEHALKEVQKTLCTLQGKDAPHVLGVYVGWRGKSFPLPTMVDIVSRESSAARIATAPLLSSVQALSSRLKEDGAKNRFIAVGHSFGGKILSRINSQYLAHKIGERIGLTKGGGRIKPLADTTILVNPAENAIGATKLIGLMKRYEVDYRVRAKNGAWVDLPLIVALGSEGDYAVKYGLPVWSFLKRNLGVPSMGGAASPAQERSILLSLPFDKRLHSHVMRDTEGSCKGVNSSLSKTGQLIDLNYRYRADVLERSRAMKVALFKEEGECPGVYAVEAISGGNETPFWVLPMPKAVVPGHNSFWSPNFVGLVSALYARTSAGHYGRETELSVQP